VRDTSALFAIVGARVTAYTVGAEQSYDLALREDPAVTKLGTRPDDDPPYPGGWVWRTAEEAWAFVAGASLPFVPAVYELSLPTGWDEDVTTDVGADGVHHLLHDARIVCKVPLV
jgi:hypothetical protein